MRLLREVTARWREARLGRAALGKYIILFASSIHFGWAVLLVCSASSANSTPVHILSQVFGGRYRTAFILVLVAGTAVVFPFIRRPPGSSMLALLLLPQQLVLMMSAGAGLYAAAIGHYADGVARSWAFILSDQIPVILAALLYTAAVFEASVDPGPPTGPA